MIFKISPRVISHFGENLIKNESIAVLELVKNAYDACASFCNIHFNFREGKLNFIKISDDGCGMNRNTVEDIWFTIGTDNKEKNIQNSCGRFPLGEKGIGRFGTHKLGNIITMKTKTSNDIGVLVSINWNLLKNVKSIDDFDVFLEENKNISEVGTTILIRNLKANWDRRKLRDIYRALMSLNSPFKNKNNDNFEVRITSNSGVFEGLPNMDDIMSAGMYFGKCTAEGSEIVGFEYEFCPWKSLTKVDSGRKVRLCNISEEDRRLQFYPDKKVGRQSSKSYIDLNKHKIGRFEIQLVIYETDGQILGLANTEKTALKTYLSENGGIRVYRDNVRVYNYGEQEDDWLQIDIRRVSRLGGNISNNIVIGAVMLDRKNSSGLVEKTNREGFIENESYLMLVEAVDYILSLFVRERNIDKFKLMTLYKKNKVVEPVLADLESAINLIESIDDEKAKKATMHLYRVNEQYKNVRDILLKSANAGLNLSIVIHELDKLISSLINASNRKKFEEVTTISTQIESILNGYSNLLKKTNIKIYNLSSIVKSAIDIYHYRFLDHKIVLQTNFKSYKLSAKLSESEAIGCIVNLLDNSIFWLCYAKDKNRQISIYITDQIKNYHSIIITDNGPGFNIPEEIAIEPFITGKPHNIGTGLGLHIARETMKALGGELMFLEKNDIELPNINKHDNVFIALCFKAK